MASRRLLLEVDEVSINKCILYFTIVSNAQVI